MVSPLKTRFQWTSSEDLGFPITGHGFFVDFCKALPSFWLTKAGQIGLGAGGDPWGSRGWLTIAVWAVACAAFAMWAYRRDTARA